MQTNRRFALPAALASALACLVPAQDRPPAATARPSPAAAPSCVILPPTEDVASSRRLARLLQIRRPVHVAAYRQPLQQILPALTEACGLPVTATRTASNLLVDLEIRGAYTAVEILHLLGTQMPIRTVVERNGAARVMSAKEFRAMKARARTLGQPAKRPTYFPQFEYRMVAVPGKHLPGFRLEEEKSRLKAWLAKDENRAAVAAHPGALLPFHLLAADAGGRKCRNVRWIAYEFTADGKQSSLRLSPTLKDSIVPLYDTEGVKPKQCIELLPIDMAQRGFTTLDLRLDSVQKAKDGAGGPALDYAMKDQASREFLELTRLSVNKHMAMILDHRVIGAPIVMSGIPGRGRISGLKEGQVNKIVDAIQLGKKTSLWERLFQRNETPPKK